MKTESSPQLGQINEKGEIWTTEGWVRIEPPRTLLIDASLEELIQQIENKGFKITLERR